MTVPAELPPSACRESTSVHVTLSAHSESGIASPESPLNDDLPPAETGEVAAYTNGASESPLTGDLPETENDGLNEAPLEEDDDDDLTVIVLDQNADDNYGNRFAAVAWVEQTGPEMEERRRNVLLRELRRVQRASFLHFCILCLIPTVLLLVVIGTVLGDEEDCESDATFCELEPRTFINAFTTRCVCDAIPVDREEEGP